MLNARLGDMFAGLCFSHKRPKGVAGIIVTGGFDTLVNGMPIARMADLGITMCGHPFIVMGAATALSGGRPIARLGDAVVGNGVHVILTGSPDVITN